MIAEKIIYIVFLFALGLCVFVLTVLDYWRGPIECKKRKIPSRHCKKCQHYSYKRKCPNFLKYYTWWDE